MISRYNTNELEVDLGGDWGAIPPTLEDIADAVDYIKHPPRLGEVSPFIQTIALLLLAGF